MDPTSEMMFDELGKYRRRKKRFIRLESSDEVQPLSTERNHHPEYERIPTQLTVPGVPVINPVSPGFKRRGFTIDEILAPEPDLTSNVISTVYNPTTHFVNYILPNSYIPYYCTMYWSYLFKTYGKRVL